MSGHNPIVLRNCNSALFTLPRVLLCPAVVHRLISERGVYCRCSCLSCLCRFATVSTLKDIESRNTHPCYRGTYEPSLFNRGISSRLLQKGTAVLDLQHVVNQFADLARLSVARNPSLSNCNVFEFVARVAFLKELGVSLDQILSTCPHLLTQKNLAASLKLTLQCMHRLGLEKVIVGKLLLYTPKVAEHLTERHFTCKVHFLECLNFRKDEIGSLLHTLSGKIDSLAAFVCMPLENLTFVAVCLRRLGLKKNACLFVLQKVPSVFLHSIKELSHRIQVLEWISKDWNIIGKMVLSCPPLLCWRADYLIETMEYLNDLIQDRSVLTICLQHKASILLCRKYAIRSALEFQYRLGWQKKTAVMLLIQQPSLVRSTSQASQRNAETLMKQDLDKQSICKWFFRALASAERTEKVVETKLKVLQDQGTIPVTSKKLPLYILEGLKGSSKDRRDDGLEFPLRLGSNNESSKMIEAFKKLRMHLVGAGIPECKVYKMVRDFPLLLVMADKDIIGKMDFLVKTMQRPVKEVEDCPAFFACDLELKIKPRHRVLQWLKATGVLEKDPPLSTIVHMSSDWFIDLFVECYPEGLIIYKGGSSPSKDGQSS